jgi:hypothetical protein
VARTARTMLLVEQVAHDLEQEGVKLEFSSQPFANDPMGRQMITMLAEMETSARSIKLADTWDTLRRKGRWHGSGPYGYVRSKGTIVFDPNEIDGARRIFDLALAGASSGRIRDTLIDEHVPTRFGGVWEKTIIRNILENPTYAGAMKIAGEIMWPPDGETWHEPLIPRADWEYLQTILRRVAHVRSKPFTSWCEGLIEHACGHRMYLVPIHAPHGKVPCFRCAGRQLHPRCRVVHTTVSGKNVEIAARQALIQSLTIADDIERVIREAIDAQKVDGSIDARRSIAKRRAAAEHERSEAEHLLLTGRRDRAWFAAKDDQVSARLAALDTEEASLPAAIPADEIRHRATSIEAVAAELATADDGELCGLVLRELGGVLVVGEGGVWTRFPPEIEAVLLPRSPVRIHNAKIKRS